MWTKSELAKRGKETKVEFVGVLKDKNIHIQVVHLLHSLRNK